MLMTLPEGSPWRPYLRRERLMWITLVAAIPLFAVSARLLGAFQGGPNAHLFIPLALVACAPFGVAHSALTSFKCPRCKKPFFKKRLFSITHFFRKECVHCRMPKWTSSFEPGAGAH